MSVLASRQTNVRPEPGDALLHPIPLLAIALLIVNDHFLKAVYPGVVSGKLSDFAGLTYFPLFLQAAWEVVSEVRGRRSVADQAILLRATLATAFVFAAIKTLPTANQAFALALGTLQYAIALIPAALTSGLQPHLSAAAVALDVTDLIALPAVVLAYAVGRSRAARAAA